MIGVIKAAINVSAVVLVIAQAAGPHPPVKHESKKVSRDNQRQLSLDQTGKASSFRLTANDLVTFVPSNTSAVSNRSRTATICPSTTINSGPANKMVKAGFRPVHSNRTFLSD